MGVMRIVSRVLGACHDEEVDGFALATYARTVDLSSGSSTDFRGELIALIISSASVLCSVLLLSSPSAFSLYAVAT